MTHLTQRPSRALFPAGSALRAAATRDVLWGRPVFRAPQLNPRVPLEPLPFMAARVSQRARAAQPAPLFSAPAPAN